MVLNDTMKMNDDSIIMEFECNDEHESEIMQVALFVYINASNEKLPENTQVNVYRDGDVVRVISHKGRDVVRDIVGECIELLATMQDDGTF